MEQTKQKYKLSNDFIFKKIFAQDENSNELIDLLEAILDIKIEYVEMGYKEEQEIAIPKLEMHFIELPKFIKKNGGTKTKLEQWLWLISGREDKIKMAEKENAQLKKTSEVLDKMNLTDSERELYESRELGLYFQQLGLVNAEEEGEKIGINKSKKDFCKKLLARKTSDEDIIDLLEISKEELEKMKQELKEAQSI